MKKSIALTMLVFLASQNLFAEQSMSKLEHVNTADCSYAEIKRVIVSSSERIMYADKNLTILEEALKISEEQKKAGTSAALTSVTLGFDSKEYTGEVGDALKTVEEADFGKVITVNPRPYKLTYTVKEGGRDVKQGVIQTLITCRIEKKDKNTPIITTARLVSFQVDPVE